jgi:hypothetical protein
MTTNGTGTGTGTGVDLLALLGMANMFKTGGADDPDPPATSTTSFDLEALPPRPRRGDRPIVTDDTPVHVRGNALSPMLWRGRQWAVTTYGIERLDGCYPIEAERLGEGFDSKLGLDGTLPARVTGKRWCDAEDFLAAWVAALSLHGVHLNPDQVRGAIRHSIDRTKVAAQ